MLIGCLASPTDPSATIAVVHEFHAKGDVTSTVLAVSALDDVFGIINYSFSIVLAAVLIQQKGFHIYSSVLYPLLIIVGSIAMGAAFGFIFNIITRFIVKETEGVFIVIIIGLLSLCFGLAHYASFDELLATMVMGIVVVNFNPKRDLIFTMLTRYTEELIFVLFFTISGMYLNLSAMKTSYPLILFFIAYRAIGKFTGTLTGATISKSSVSVKKYTVGGLLPSGGIVIGLALLIKQNTVFSHISDILLNIIIGSTIIHELIGPVIAKFSLKKAGEINTQSK